MLLSSPGKLRGETQGTEMQAFEEGPPLMLVSLSWRRDSGASTQVLEKRVPATGASASEGEQ